MRLLQSILTVFLMLPFFAGTVTGDDSGESLREKERLLKEITIARAEGLEPVVMAHVHFPPFSYTDDSGQPAGVLIDYARTLLGDFGLQHQFLEIPISRIYQRLANGDLHFWMGSKGTPTLRELTISSKEPYGHLRLYLFGLTGSNPPALDALKDTRLITIQGYEYSGVLDALRDKPGVRFLPTPNHVAAFAMLKTGRGEYVLDYEGPSLEAMKKTGLQNLATRMLQEIPSHMVVSKKAPKPELLLAVLENAMKRFPMPARASENRQHYIAPNR